MQVNLLEDVKKYNFRLYKDMPLFILSFLFDKASIPCEHSTLCNVYYGKKAGCDNIEDLLLINTFCRYLDFAIYGDYDSLEIIFDDIDFKGISWQEDANECVSNSVAVYNLVQQKLKESESTKEKEALPYLFQIIYLIGNNFSPLKLLGITKLEELPSMDIRKQIDIFAGENS